MNFKFIKANFNPQTKNNTILENERYLLEGISRYNLTIRDKRKVNNRNIVEFDGVIEYSQGLNKKGIIICESKIGRLGYFNIGEDKEEKIYHKIIEPIASLFPNHDIDLLLMGTKEEILLKSKYNPLRKGLEKLNSILNKHNIGLIPFIFSESREKIDNIASSLIILNEIKNENYDTIPEENRYIISNGIIRLIKGKRIELILNKTGENTYKVIYSFKN
jgi:hypothetical protein